MSSNVTAAQVAPGVEGVNLTDPVNATLEIVDADAGLIRPAHGTAWRKKFAICGFAQSSRMLAPFADPAYYVIGLNQLYRHIPRADMWFDIHRNWREDNVPGTDHVKWLAECGMPIFMVERMPELPTSVRYPIERVIERVVGMDYETSTVAFMVAWAIDLIDQQVEAEVAAASNGHLAVTASNLLSTEESRVHEAMNYGKAKQWIHDRYAEREISLWGIDLIVGTEYDYQKACVEYMLGLAHARGIVVRLPPASALLKQPWRYGYEAEPVQHPIKQSELFKRGQALTAEKNTLLARLQTIDGALQELSYWHDIATLRNRGGHVRPNEATSS